MSNPTTKEIIESLTLPGRLHDFQRREEIVAHITESNGAEMASFYLKYCETFQPVETSDLYTAWEAIQLCYIGWSEHAIRSEGPEGEAYLAARFDISSRLFG